MKQALPSWLHNIVHTQPVLYWPWRHSLRLILITTVPLSIGLLYGHIADALFVCLGGLLSAISVQTDPYRERFHRIFIAVLFGMSGFFIGAQIAGQGVLTIAGVVIVALFSSWISFWGKAFSAGALQMLIMTVIASHAPPSSMSFMAPVLYGTGALYAALLLSVEALLIPKRPEEKQIALLLGALAQLARTSAQTSVDDSARNAALRKATEAQVNAYSVLSIARFKGVHADDTQTAGAQILAITDRLIVLLSEPKNSSEQLRQAAAILDDRATAILKPNAIPATAAHIEGAGSLSSNLNALLALVCTPLIFTKSWPPLSERFMCATNRLLDENTWKAQIVAQRGNLINMLSLSLCMFVAMLAEFHLPGSRSYWIPLSVAVILKPDFGSVFTRAIQRSAGTLAGVVLAILIFHFVPKGFWLLVVIGCLSAAIPWASLKNYAWQCMFLTPLILILMDLIIAGPTVDYGAQRLVDTLLGAAIVLVFGYLIWPKPAKTSFWTRYTETLKTISAYLDALKKAGKQDDLFAITVQQRHNAYAGLIALRKWEQGFLSEPSVERDAAHLWLPHVSQAEYLVDRIGHYILSCERENKQPEASKVQQLFSELEGLSNITTVHMSG